MRYTFIHFTVDHREIDEITHVTQEDNLPRVSAWKKMTIDLDCELSSIPGNMNLAHSVWFEGGPNGCNGKTDNCPPKYGKGIAVFANQSPPAINVPWEHEPPSTW